MNGYTNAHCENCGKAYYRQRSTSKFCSDACRVKHYRKASPVRIDDLFNTAANAIAEIGKYSEGDSSFQAISFLKTLEQLASYQNISGASSWWRCSKCWGTVQKELPTDGDCKCGKAHDANWKLQKKML